MQASVSRKTQLTAVVVEGWKKNSRQEIKEEIKTDMNINKNGNTMIPNLLDAEKEILSGKFIAI